MHMFRQDDSFAILWWLSGVPQALTPMLAPNRPVAYAWRPEEGADVLWVGGRVALLSGGKSLVAVSESASVLLGVRVVKELRVGASWVKSAHLVQASGVSLTYPVPDVDAEEVVHVVQLQKGEVS